MRGFLRPLAFHPHLVAGAAVPLVPPDGISLGHPWGYRFLFCSGCRRLLVGLPGGSGFLLLMGFSFLWLILTALPPSIFLEMGRGRLGRIRLYQPLPRGPWSFSIILGLGFGLCWLYIPVILLLSVFPQFSRPRPRPRGRGRVSSSGLEKSCHAGLLRLQLQLQLLLGFRRRRRLVLVALLILR